MLKLPKLSKMLGTQVYVKLEQNNIGGSIKDRTAKEIILKAMERNELKEGGTIIEGTSGSTGIALSSIANVLNCKTKIILPDNLAEEKYKILELFNAELIKVPPRNFIDEENFIRKAENLVGSNSNNFYSDQFENFDNFWVHYNETGPEIYDQLEEEVDFFVGSAGTGGTLSGVTSFLKSKLPNFRSVVADCPGSSLFSFVNSGVLFTNEEKEVNKRKTPDYTIIEGIGQNRLTENFERGSYDLAFKVKDIESMHMSHYLIQNEGIFIGGSSCLNIVAICKLVHYLKNVEKVSEDKLKKMKIVTVINDSGFRYLSKFYNNEYVKKYQIDFQKLEKYDSLDFIDFNFND